MTSARGSGELPQSSSLRAIVHPALLTHLLSVQTCMSPGLSCSLPYAVEDLENVMYEHFQLVQLKCQC